MITPPGAPTVAGPAASALAPTPEKEFILTLAPWLYILVLVCLVVCLGRGHRAGKINLWDLVTATNDEGKVHTDGRKLFEAGAFAIMATAFAYWALIDRLTEWYALLFVSSFVVARAWRDREQRLNKQIDKAPAGAGMTKPDEPA